MSYRADIVRLEDQADRAVELASTADDAEASRFLTEALVCQLRALRLAVSEAFAPEVEVEQRDVVGPFHRREPENGDPCARDGCGHAATLHVRLEDGSLGECHASLWSGTQLESCGCPEHVPRLPQPE